MSINELFDPLLFHRPAMINGTPYYACTQIYYFDNDIAFNLVLFKNGVKNTFSSTDSIQILNYDIATMNLYPIERNLINEIVRILKILPLKEEIRVRLLSVPSERRYYGTGNQTLKLANHVFCQVADKSRIIASKKKVGVILEDVNSRITPNAFCFFCNNETDFNVCISVVPDEICECKNWHFLAGYKIELNDIIEPIVFMPVLVSITESGVFIASKIYELIILSSKSFHGLKAKMVPPGILVDFMLSIGGFPHRVSLPDNALLAHDWYTVVIPICTLHIENEIDLGNVRFVSRSNPNVKNMLSFAVSNLDQYSSFAFVHVNESLPFAAYKKACEQIERGLDLLISLQRRDLLAPMNPFTSSAYSFNLSNLECKVLKVAPIAYITSSLSKQELYFDDSPLPDDNKVNASDAIVGSINELSHVEMLLIASSDGNRPEIEPILNSFRWARKAWESRDAEDAIIYVCIALEFLVAKEENAALIDKSKRKLLKNDIEASIRRIFEIGELECQFVNKVIDKFDFAYSDTPFMEKLARLIKRLDIPISSREFELIKDLRKKRNAIVHGKGRSETPVLDIERVCESITTIALHLMNSLEE